MTSKITICICIRLSVQFYYPELSVSGYPANFTIRNYLYPAIWQILLSVHLYKAWLLWLLRLTKKAKSALNHAPCFFTTQVYQNLPIQKSLHHLHDGHGMVVRAITLSVWGWLFKPSWLPLPHQFFSIYISPLKQTQYWYWNYQEKPNYS